MTGYDESVADVGGVATWIRHKPGTGTPVVFWHGNPTDADDWLPFFEATDAPCYAADLPGFGRSGRPDPRDFDYTLGKYGRWAQALVGHLSLERYDTVVHDWGGIGLLAAMNEPDRVRRAVVFNCVPFGVGYEWHWIARWFWRRRGLGEVFNALSRPPGDALILRQARPGWRPMPAGFVRRMRRNIGDPVSRQAILRLYRSAEPVELDRYGRALEALTAPTLILWGSQDPYIPLVYGRRLADLLPDAELLEAEGAGHWPWLDRPDLVRAAIQHLA